MRLILYQMTIDLETDKHNSNILQFEAYTIAIDQTTIYSMRITLSHM